MYFWYAYNNTTKTMCMATDPCVEFDGLGTHNLYIQLIKDTQFSIQINYDDDINFYLLKYNKSKEVHSIVNEIYTTIKKDGIDELPDHIKIIKKINFKIIFKLDDIKNHTNNNIYYDCEKLYQNKSVGFIEIKICHNEFKFRFTIVQDRRGKPYFYATHPNIELI